MRRTLRLLFLPTLLLACATAPAPEHAPSSAATAAAPAPQDEADQPLGIDPRIKVGKLANGLTTYVMAHKKPEKRAQLWLVVNAGATQEDDDQRGLAHFVEHMSFNGTKRFPKGAIVDYLESIGTKFGPDLNAYTSFDETVYMLQVPTDRPELVGKGLQILRDWAGGVAFDAAEIEKERGVVMEEWRLGRGAGMRLFDRQAPVFFHKSKYAERIPIGKPEIIKGAPRDALVRFYQDWYRPDLMAVIAVGDFEPAEIEKSIAAELGDLSGPAKPRARGSVEMPGHAETLVSIETDPEMPFASVVLIQKMPHRSERSARDYRRFVADQLYHAMLNARLDELRRKPDAPFMYAGSATGDLVRAADAFIQSAVFKEGGLERALEALVAEAARVERHGFTEPELDRAKKNLLREYQRTVTERDKKDAREFTSEIVRNFLEGEMMPGIEAELGLVERFLPTFTLAELNRLPQSWAGAGGRVIAVSGPEAMKKPEPRALLAVEKAVLARALAPWADAASNVPLMAAPPKPGTVKKTETLAEIGVSVWTLSNGARVVVKPTDFANDEVRFSAFSPGGHSLVKDPDFESAAFSDTIVGESGIGALDAVALGKALTGKIASVHARVGELDEGLSGRASPADLETLLQLAHLHFTAPRRDAAAFEAWRTRQAEQVRNRRLSPEVSFWEDMQVVMTQNHRRRQPESPEMLAKVNLDKALRIYRDRFAEAGDFTFLFVGNLDLGKLRPLVETYLASLPTRKRKESWRDVGVHMPKGIKTKTIAKGREPKSVVMLAFHGKEKWTRDTDNDMRMLSEVLGTRLREVLREDMGGVYGVSVHGGISRRPRPEYGFNVTFGCAPDNADKLRQAVFDEIKAIQDKGIAEEYLAKTREARLRQHELDLKDNGFWMGELSRAFTYSDDPKQIPDIRGDVEKMTSARVQAAAKKYLAGKDYVLGVLKPEGASTAAPTAAPPRAAPPPSPGS